MYLDPGFGGMLLQVIVALVAAGGATLFSFRKKITSLFSKEKKPSNVNQSLPKHDNSDDDIIDTLSDKK